MKSRASMIKELDDIASKICRITAGYRCVKCNKFRPEGDFSVQAHHLRRRRHLSMRWNQNNLFCLCLSCHIKAHENENEFEDWVLNTYGSKRLKELEVYHDTGRMNNFELVKTLSEKRKNLDSLRRSFVE